MLYSPGTEVVAASEAPKNPKILGVQVVEEPIKPVGDVPHEEEAPKPELPKGVTLADTIRAEREAREAKAKYEGEQESLRKRAEEAEGKLKATAKDKDNILLDAAGYLTSIGLKPHELALVGEAIMYHLVPDKAPPDLRARMVEAQYKRDQILRDERDAKKAIEEQEKMTKAEAEAGKAVVQKFEKDVTDFAPTLSATSAPSSYEWFGSDHEDYAASLYHTASNMAREANKAGARADFSVQNVAAVLEKHLANKLGKLKAPKEAVRTPGSKQASVSASQPGKVPGVVELKKKENAISEKELIANAVKAAFGG